MKPENEMEMLLWGYIDGLAEEPDKIWVEKMIAENTEWRAKYNELLQFHLMITAADLEQPSLRFTKNVMEEISKYEIAPATKKYINNKIIWGIAAFLLSIITGILIDILVHTDWTTNNYNSFKDFGLSQIDYSKLFNNSFINIVIMVNIILGLMLLDRYLTHKKKKLLS